MYNQPKRAQQPVKETNVNYGDLGTVSHKPRIKLFELATYEQLHLEFNNRLLTLDRGYYCE